MDTKALRRIATEAYGDGAWHGNDLKAALADVSAELAYWRPGKGRHNIAEIALHHAYTVRNVRVKLLGDSGSVEPFAIAGEDWFALDDKRALAWPKVLDAVEQQHAGLLDAISALGSAKLASDVKPFDLVL
ncbi:MAG TPA: DinB family protein, partial [Gemmatimonadaceae bacterium]